MAHVYTQIGIRQRTDDHVRAATRGRAPPERGERLAGDHLSLGAQPRRAAAIAAGGTIELMVWAREQVRVALSVGESIAIRKLAT